MSNKKMVSTVTKTLLKNVIRHTDAHNKVVEEGDMWRQREKELQDSDRRGSSYSFLKDRGVDMRYEFQDRQDRHAHMDEEPKNTYWMKELYKAEAADNNRWGHNGYKELYPDQFSPSHSSGSSGDDTSRKRNRAPKAKLKKKKRKRERSHSAPRSQNRKLKRRHDSESSDSDSGRVKKKKYAATSDLSNSDSDSAAKDQSHFHWKRKNGDRHDGRINDSSSIKKHADIDSNSLKEKKRKRRHKTKKSHLDFESEVDKKKHKHKKKKKRKKRTHSSDS